MTAEQLAAAILLQEKINRSKQFARYITDRRENQECLDVHIGRNELRCLSPEQNDSVVRLVEAHINSNIATAQAEFNAL